MCLVGVLVDGEPRSMAGMASSETSIRHGVWVRPNPSVPVEAVLLAVGHANLSYASRMNKGVVVFLKEECFVAASIVSGVSLKGVYLQVSLLAVPSARHRFKCSPIHSQRGIGSGSSSASGSWRVALGSKNDKLKHVQSFRRQVFMFLNCPSQTLDVSLRVKHGEGHYMVYASTGSMKCFECEDVGHKWTACPQRMAEGRLEPGSSGPAEERTHTAPRGVAPQRGRKGTQRAGRQSGNRTAS